MRLQGYAYHSNIQTSCCAPEPSNDTVESAEVTLTQKVLSEAAFIYVYWMIQHHPTSDLVVKSMVQSVLSRLAMAPCGGRTMPSLSVGWSCWLCSRVLYGIQTTSFGAHESTINQCSQKAIKLQLLQPSFGPSFKLLGHIMDTLSEISNRWEPKDPGPFM